MPKGCLKMKSVELAEIQATVARKFSITTDQMLSRTRNQAVIFACQIAMYIARMHTTKSLPEIAASFNKTHAAVLYGITTIKKCLEEEPNLASTVSGILEELEAIESKRRDEVKFNETRQRFGDVATNLQAVLALKDVFIQVVSSEQSGRFTKVTAKMSRSDIKWLIENKFTIPKEIGSDSIRVVESDDGLVSIEVGLPFERWKDLSYHDVMFDVFYGSGKTETEDMSLPVIFGKMSNGEIVTRDLARLPHLLMGGLSGSGKSVFLNSLICSLVQTHSPEQLRFVLMDPKRVEFGIYAKLPHLYSPIAHEPEQAVTILKHVESEMDMRLALFGEKGCRNIADFNNANEVTRLPYLVVVVDELSDFIDGSEGAFKSTATRIAAIGRSAGVHLVMATSRPDARIASGSLKANIPGRLAFRVCQKVDSRTLLDEYGAEDLLGRGDVLLTDCKGEVVRLQVPYIRDEAVKRIVESAIMRYPGRQIAVGITSSTAEKEDHESMYARALNLVHTTRRASISWLQRQLNIGYKDAARVMSLLEERGIIGPANDKGSREILIEDNRRGE